MSEQEKECTCVRAMALQSPDKTYRCERCSGAVTCGHCNNPTHLSWDCPAEKIKSETATLKRYDL